jgi:glycine/D-amino acid oxidase-like deaminating enzyme
MAGEGNTCKSAAGVRNTFSSPENQMLTNSSIDFFRAIEETDFNLHLRLIGYLWMMDQEQYAHALPAIVSMKKNNIDFSLLESDELKKIPGLNVDKYDTEECEMLGLKPIQCGLLGRNCGSLDPSALVTWYEQEFRRLGGEVRYNTEVTELLVRPEEPLDLEGEPLVWQTPKLVGVQTTTEEILADTVILATGAWASHLLDPLGIDSHIRPKKRQFFQVKGSALDDLFTLDGFNNFNTLPFTILHKAGIYIKPEPKEECFYVGCADNLKRPFNLDDQPEREYYLDQIFPVLVEVFPQFENATIENMVAGSYAYNTIDKNPYVFRPMENLLLVTGGSGSGIMKCDSIGRIAAANYFKEEYAMLYPDRPFRVDKLATVTRSVTPEEFII